MLIFHRYLYSELAHSGKAFINRHFLMAILDQEEQTPGATGKTLAGIGGAAYILATVSALVRLYGDWLSRSALSAEGSPDATQLADAVMILLMAQSACVLAMVLGLVFQMLASYQYECSPPWLWKVMLATGVVVTLSSFLPFSPWLLILGLVLLVHAFSRKDAYRHEFV